MKNILVSTVSYKNEPLEMVLYLFKSIGFRNIELHLNPLYHDILNPLQAKKLFEKFRIKPYVFSGGWCDFFSFKPDINKTFNSVKKQVAIAKELRCNVIRLFFGRLSLFDYNQSHLNSIVNNLLCLSDRYKEITFVFENHDGASLNPKVCQEILQTVNKRNIQMNFDPINFERSGVSSKEALTILIPYIKHVHLKGLNGNELCEYGEGDVDLDSVINVLLDSNYNGYFTLEYEGRKNPTIRLMKSYEKLNRMLR